mmetsp:Transcript_92745/g.160518  ORF Transcript_92745/g.160518 Transcript_92745/m.160518 type:complete len:381 (-) Transcript_92745:159-1301(-)
MGNGCNQCSDADAGPQEMVYTATYADIVHARETSLLMQPYDAQDINRGQEVEFAWDPANPELSQYMLATVAINIERQLEMQDRMIKKLLEDSDAEEARLRALTDVADNEASASSDNAADANGDAQPPLVDLSGASTASPPGAHAGADSRRDGADRSSQLRDRISELTEENRQLRETVVQLKAAPPPREQTSGLTDGLHHARQPSGASTQRASEPTPASGAQQTSGSGASGAPSGQSGTQSGGGSGIRQQYSQQASGLQAVSASTAAEGTRAATANSVSSASGTSAQASTAQEEPLRQIVYSSANSELTATIGPTTLQGVGTVDGVAMVAKVLLQRIHSSVCAAHRRAPPPTMAASMAAPGQPTAQPGQLAMVGMMPSGNI